MPDIINSLTQQQKARLNTAIPGTEKNESSQGTSFCRLSIANYNISQTCQSWLKLEHKSLFGHLKGRLISQLNHKC